MGKKLELGRKCFLKGNSFNQCLDCGSITGAWRRKVHAPASRATADNDTAPGPSERNADTKPLSSGAFWKSPRGKQFVTAQHRASDQDGLAPQNRSVSLIAPWLNPNAGPCRIAHPVQMLGTWYTNRVGGKTRPAHVRHKNYANGAPWGDAPRSEGNAIVMEM